MNLHISSIILTLACVAGLLRAQTPDIPHPATARFHEARKAAEAAYRENLEALADYYDAFLKTRADAFQSRGKLEPLLLILAERETVEETLAPGGAEVPPEVTGARRVFAERRREMEEAHRARLMELREAYVSALNSAMERLAREGRIDDAKALEEEKGRMEARLAEAAGDPGPLEKRPGPNLLPGGDFDQADEGEWHVEAPGGRNKTGFHQERNSGGNQTLRLEQDADRNLGIYRKVEVKRGTPYRLTWKARMLSPWEKDILLRGKGRCFLGLQVPESRWDSLSPLQQKELSRREGAGREPPPDTGWRQESATLVPGKWMSEFYIRVSKGEGEFLIDDIELREILPPESGEDPPPGDT